MTHHAVRVDMECNGDTFWDILEEVDPKLARSLRRNGCAIVGNESYGGLVIAGAFDGEPSPLIDLGTTGDGFAEVAGARHEVFE